MTYSLNVNVRISQNFDEIILYLERAYRNGYSSQTMDIIHHWQFLIGTYYFKYDTTYFLTRKIFIIWKIPEHKRHALFEYFIERLTSFIFLNWINYSIAIENSKDTHETANVKEVQWHCCGIYAFDFLLTFLSRFLIVWLVRTIYLFLGQINRNNQIFYVWFMMHWFLFEIFQYRFFHQPLSFFHVLTYQTAGKLLTTYQ